MVVLSSSLHAGRIQARHQWLFGSNGEPIYLAEPSQKARRQVLRQASQTDATAQFVAQGSGTMEIDALFAGHVSFPSVRNSASNNIDWWRGRGTDVPFTIVPTSPNRLPI